MSIKAKLLMLLALAGLILVGCGDKGAIDRAKAERIQQATQDEAVAREAEEARKQRDWEATRQAVNLAKIIVFVAAGVFLAFALAILVYRLWQMSRSVQDAFAVYAEKRAELAAGTIKLDRETRTFPSLVADNAVHNLETAQVYRLGKPRSADPQQVTASGQVRALGVTAQAAERIGKSTKDAQAADAIPGLTGAVPLVLPAGESQTLIIESDTSETVDL